MDLAAEVFPFTRPLSADQFSGNTERLVLSSNRCPLIVMRMEIGASISAFPLSLRIKNNTLIVLIEKLFRWKMYCVGNRKSRCPMVEPVGNQLISLKIRE